jgi:uncharacterized iron-regulated membrane protein
MRNKREKHITERPQSQHSAAGVWRRIVLGLGVAVSTTLFTSGILAQEATSSQASAEAAGEQEAVAGQEAVAESQAAQQRADEAPLEVSPTAKPTLDYVPSETISEDSSVSFPVDI